MNQYQIDGSTVGDFTKLFLPKAEYLAAIKEMSLKERAFDWKPSNRVEELVKETIIERALVKTGAGSLRVTSYLLQADADAATAFISYGGKQPRLTSEGRDNDVGGFFRATAEGDGIQVSVQTRYPSVPM